MLAMMPMNAIWKVSTEVIRKTSPSLYFSEEESRKIAGNVKMKPIEALVAPVVAEVEMLISEGDHCKAIPSR